jgi:hypothetical protein
MDPLTHLYHHSLIPADRLGYAGYPARTRASERRPGRVRESLRAAWGVIRDLSRQSTIEWVERMESLQVREALR